jgi:histidinol phosphatase-like enzyme (inositol monophosphatase family)
LPTLASLLSVARTAAIAGGRRTLEHFGGRIPSETKPDGSPVTPADRASEGEIRRLIRRKFPSHTIVGEEGGIEAGDPRIRWIIDPIDGTKSFIHGVPLYCVQVAVEVEGVPSVGVVHLPALGETVDAAVGLGCRWNGRTTRVSTVGDLRDATLVTTSVRSLESHGVSFRRLYSATRTQRGWSDGYGYVLVATGRADVALDAEVYLWDCAPLLPILEEAGGRFTDWAGVRTIGSPNCLGTNGLLHEAMLKLL